MTHEARDDRLERHELPECPQLLPDPPNDVVDQAARRLDVLTGGLANAIPQLLELPECRPTVGAARLVGWVVRWDPFGDLVDKCSDPRAAAEAAGVVTGRHAHCLIATSSSSRALCRRLLTAGTVISRISAISP